MALQFGVLVPQGWTMDRARIKDPVEAYETMTSVAQTADEVGFASAWLVDHFHTIPHPSQEVTFECWVSTAALARDTSNIRIGQMAPSTLLNGAALTFWPARSSPPELSLCSPPMGQRAWWSMASPSRRGGASFWASEHIAPS